MAGQSCWHVGDRVLCRYINKTAKKLYYEAKVIDVEQLDEMPLYVVHFDGWKNLYNERIPHDEAVIRFKEYTEEAANEAKEIRKRVQADAPLPRKRKAEKVKHAVPGYSSSTSTHQPSFFDNYDNSELEPAQIPQALSNTLNAYNAQQSKAKHQKLRTGTTAEKPTVIGRQEGLLGTQSDEGPYCSCQQNCGEEEGPMIECDSKQCKYKWFHFTCVGITAAPEGEWYCQTCIERRCSTSTDDRLNVTIVMNSVNERVHGEARLLQGELRELQEKDGQNKTIPKVEADAGDEALATGGSSAPKNDEQLRERAETSINNIFKYFNKKIIELKREITVKDIEIARKNSEISAKVALVTAKTVENSAKADEIIELETQIAQLQDLIKKMNCNKQRAVQLLLGQNRPPAADL